MNSDMRYQNRKPAEKNPDPVHGREKKKKTEAKVKTVEGERLPDF